MRRLQLLALVAAIAAVLVSAVPVFAAAPSLFADTTTSASSTYEAVPGTGDIKVKVTLRVRNDTPDYVESYSCDEYVWDPYYYQFIAIPKTCERRTRYYVNTTYLTVESDAGTVKVTSNAGKVKKQLQTSIVPSASSFESYELTFPKIWKGQTRTITATYLIHAGAARVSTFHVNGAYMDFWAIAQPTDKASVKVIVPAAFDTSTWGGTVTSSVKDGKRTYSSGSIADPTSYYVGVTGTNEDGYAESMLTAPSGREIRIQGWPGDDPWIDWVSREASASMVALEQLVGRPIPGTGPVTLREVEGSSLGDAYIGAFDPTDQVATISEYFNEPGTVAHEISHAWFNGSLFDGHWLSEGYASWAERAVGENTTACDDGLLHYHSEFSAKPDIGTWLIADPRATQDQLDAVAEQYAAACQVITDVATEIGPDGMRGVLAVLSTSEGAYPGTTDPKLGAPNDWRAWLDAVDERGMLPAKKDSVAAMAGVLVDYGVATPDDLLGRSDARSELEKLRAAAGYLALPAAVYDPMGGWDFPGATKAMGEVSATLADIDAVSTTLPLAKIDNPLRARVSSAETLPDLVDLHAQADEQVETATLVSDAIERDFADQGPIAEVGLLGVDRHPLVDAAIADVGRLDFADARAQIAALDASAAGAFSSGLMRIGGVLLLVAMAIGGVLWVRRRNRPVAVLVAAEAADAGPLEPFEAVMESPTVITTVPLAAVADAAPEDSTAGDSTEPADAGPEPVKPAKRARRTKLREPSDPADEPPSSGVSAA